MAPFYIMVFAAGLVAANLLFQLVRLPVRPQRVLAYQRRESLLDFQERLCLGTVEEAVGRDFRVFPRVAARAVLAGDVDLRRRKRRAAERALAGRMFDLLVCSAADAHPLCAVLANPAQPTRLRRRELKFLREACADAGLPLVELELKDGYELSAIRRELLGAIESAEVRVSTAPDQVAEDEETLLAELAAAMQEPDGRAPRRRR
ncbi:MAG: DUF2726 domain-containing protein [Thiohalocapsa sp.]|uniref:DUF2726 domain-containing protein n=1 Tax=Thiohalocapsa sp. TaxID=2497641 RepID=UPI0025CB9800|nr:DUF2726 domain-containing protein [Thiohalocapsa sp.]MCG6940538.1 DUF2726 domain-containing protein [Thiohalocapsa sp.]